MIEKPSDAQRPTMLTAASAQPGLAIQYGPSIPISDRR